MLQQVQVHSVSPQNLAHQLSMKHWWTGDISRALFTAKSCSPTVLLRETHIRLSICCHTQFFRYSQEFLLRKDSFWWWCQSLLIYLTWKTANVQLPVILLFSYPWNSDIAVCIPSPSNHPMLILMLDLGDAFMFSAGTKGRQGRVPVRYSMGPNNHVGAALEMGGGKIWETEGREKEEGIFFFPFKALPAPFPSSVTPFTPLHSCRLQPRASMGDPSCHCVTPPEQTHLVCQLLFWLGFLFQGEKKSECRANRDCLLISYFLCCGSSFFCAQLSMYQIL